ncbi:MAG: sulfite exporter TauE/SafE family protein [Tardiphaga sp.]
MAVQSRQARRLDQAKTLAFSSLPAALIGGFIVLDERLYNAVTGAVLLIAAAILIVGQTKDGLPDRATPLWEAITTGAVVGFVSGLTGVGGGVFLAPILIALRWASPKQTSALSAPFILRIRLWASLARCMRVRCLPIRRGSTPSARSLAR